MEKLKQQIKVLAEQQLALKNQRKTANRKGPKTMEPWQASLTHQNNRAILRELYYAYGSIRGKKSEDKSKTPINMDNVNKIITQYAEALRSNS